MAKHKILLVDDEVGFAQLLKLNLENTGRYEVKVESRGAEALKTARYFRPDLILLDVVMPDVSGREVCAQIEKDEALKNVPVIYLTATVSREEVTDRQGIVGGRPSLAKPASMKEITGCIESVLGTPA